MKTSEQRILDMIEAGEGVTTEFKACRWQLNRDVYESVCGFLNHCGGHLLLGVADTGEITGIEPEAVRQIPMGRRWTRRRKRRRKSCGKLDRTRV